MLQAISSHNKQVFQFIDQANSRVQSICHPLFQSFNLNQFAYMRVYNDGKIFRLVAHKEWSKKFFESEFYNDCNFFSKQMFNMPVGNYHYRTLTGVPQGSHWQAIHEFNIWNILIYYKKNRNFLECCCFGTLPENTQIIDFYMNNIDVLNKFIFSFKEKTRDLIEDDNKYKFIISELNPLENVKKEINNRDNFLKIIKNNKISLYLNKSYVSISSRQYEVLVHLASSKTAKEIGKILNISPRTVESYIQSIKLKTKLYEKKELVSQFLKNIDTEILSGSLIMLALLEGKNYEL